MGVQNASCGELGGGHGALKISLVAANKLVADFAIWDGDRFAKQDGRWLWSGVSLGSDRGYLTRR